MKVLIVEDEERNANKLMRLLHQINPDIQVLAIVESIQTSVSWLENNTPPDLIFMDIRLEDGLCFEIFKQIQINVPVVFTTSYDEYALKAFKVNSIDYIMKPVQEEDLIQALEKYNNLNTIGLNDSIQHILRSLNKKETTYRSRFLIPYKDGFRAVKVEEIDYFYSELKITHLVLKDKSEMIISQTMEEVEEELNPAFFFRANRQYILEIDSIHNIQNYYNGKLKVTLIRDTQREIIISRDKSPLFKNWLNS